MAKFRSNHSSGQRGKHAVGASMVRPFIFFIVLCIGLWLLSKNLERLFSVDSTEKAFSIDEKYYLPQNSSGQVVEHQYYSLSYSEEHEQAEWVAYILTKKSLDAPNVPRTDWFSADTAIHTQSSVHSDYSRSGYTRGHLVPAGDRAFNKEAMEETFLMSNITPQKAAFNGGIWKELEENIREWALDRDSLLIFAGPVFGDNMTKIGKRNKISVPQNFYKIVFDPRRQESISFLIPNNASQLHLSSYITSIDQIEAATSLDFFDYLLDDTAEDSIERLDNNPGFTFDKNKFKRRLAQK